MGFPVYIKASRRRLSVGKEIREVNRLRLNYERRMMKRLMTLFAKSGRQAARAYENGADVRLALKDFPSEVSAVFRAHYASVIEAFGKRVLDGRKQDTRFEQFIDEYYRRQALIYSSITQTQYNQIFRAILIGEEDALGVDAIAKLIVERTSGSIARARAATIARTETHGAASFATHELQGELDLPMIKRWSSVGDARTRDHHRAMNGVEVPYDEPFKVRVKGREYLMDHTHDPNGGAINNINCRCVTLYITDEDALFD